MTDERKRLLILQYLKEEYPSNIFDLVETSRSATSIYYDLYVFGEWKVNFSTHTPYYTAPHWDKSYATRWIQSLLIYLVII